MTAAQVLTVAVTGSAAGAAGWFAARLTVPYCGPVTTRRRLGLALLAGAVLGALAWRFGPGMELVAFAYFGAVGSLLAVIDVAVKRLPDPFTLPSYPIGVLLLALAAPFAADGVDRFVGALAGMAALWFCYALQYFIRPEAVGLGDVKLSGVIGLYLGWLGKTPWTIGVLAGLLLGGFFGVTLLVLRRAGRKDAIPFGPFLLAGALVGVLAGTAHA
jgi:leader peptidase (prepilin peptidase)/N-methyltransferase